MSRETFVVCSLFNIFCCNIPTSKVRIGKHQPITNFFSLLGILCMWIGSNLVYRLHLQFSDLLQYVNVSTTHTQNLVIVSLILQHPQILHLPCHLLLQFVPQHVSLPNNVAMVLQIYTFRIIFPILCLR